MTRGTQSRGSIRCRWFLCSPASENRLEYKVQHLRLRFPLGPYTQKPFTQKKSSNWVRLLQPACRVPQYTIAAGSSSIYGTTLIIIYQYAEGGKIRDITYAYTAQETTLERPSRPPSATLTRSLQCRAYTTPYSQSTAKRTSKREDSESVVADDIIDHVI